MDFQLVHSRGNGKREIMTTDSTVISISKRGLRTVCHSPFDSSVVLSVWSLFYMKKSSEIIIVENIRSNLYGHRDLVRA